MIIVLYHYSIIDKILNSIETSEVTTSRRPWTVFRLLTLINSLFVGITGPLEVVFFLSIGFSSAQIGALFAVQALGTLLSDIPTGAFADRYGRKKSLIISFSLLTLVFLVWAFAKTFPTFMILSLVWGVGFGFQNGAKTALLMDHLALSGTDDRRTRAFARLAVYGNIGLILGGLVAAAIASHSLRWIWAAAAMLQAVLAVISWIGLRNDSTTPTAPGRVLRSIYTDALHGIRSYFTVMPFPLLLLLESVTTFILSAYVIVIPIYLRLTWHVTNAQFGILGSLAAAIGIVGALLGERVYRRLGFQITTILFALVLMVLFFGLAVSQAQVLVILLYLLIQLILFAWDPIEQSLVNRYLPNDTRTVMLSISSSTNLVLHSLVQGAVGLLLITFRPPTLIMSLGIVFLAWPIITNLLVRFHNSTIEEKPLDNVPSGGSKLVQTWPNRYQ